MAGLSILRVVSNADLVKQEREEARRAVDQRQAEPVLLGMAAYMRTAWDAAKHAKEPIEDIMLKALRQRNGEYEADKLGRIHAHGGSDIYMMITEVKCRAAESWLRDILMDTGTPPWDLRPTPIPDIPDEANAAIEQALGTEIIRMISVVGQNPDQGVVAEMREIMTQQHRFKLMQEATNRSERMKTRIEDQFAQGGWSEAFNEFLTDLVTLPAAIVKGPVVRRQRKLSWGTDENGKIVAETTEALAPEYERVDPFRIYPEPGISRFQEGYVFEHHPMPRHELADMIGVPGYDDDAIKLILEQGTSGSWIHMDAESEKEHEERKFGTERRPTDVFDALEFWGKISGKMLLDWGLDEEEIPEPEREYDANVWMVGNYIIKATLNYDPLGEIPYAKTSFIRTPGAFWGKGIPEIIEDLQGVCNAAARALVNNMGISSGPQVEVNTERIPSNEDITAIHPWKIWQVLNDPLGSSAPAIRFTQPDDNSVTLMGVYDKFSKLADDHSGVPAYIYGDLNVQGAGRTASGLSMLMGSAGKGIRQVVMHIDADIIKPVVNRQFIYNMRYDPDDSIKGDAQIVPKGAINLAVKDTVNIRRIEFLAATANEFDMEIIGREGRAAVLREVAKGLQMDADEVVPSREQAKFRKTEESQAQAQLPPPGAGGQGSPPAPGGPALQPDGSPQGGRAGNTVSSRVSGNAA